MTTVQLKDLKIGDKIKVNNDMEFVKVNNTLKYENSATSYSDDHCILAVLIKHPGFRGTANEVEFKCCEYKISKYRQWLNSDKPNNCFTEQYKGQLDENDKYISGFLYKLPKRLKDNLHVFPDIEYVSHETGSYETEHIKYSDKVCMASLLELGCKGIEIGLKLDYFDTIDNIKSFIQDEKFHEEIATRNQRDNTTYYGCKFNKEENKIQTTYSFPKYFNPFVGLLHVDKNMNIEQNSNGTYEITTNKPANIEINSANGSGVNITITGGCEYVCNVLINNSNISSKIINGEEKNIELINWNEERFSKFKLNDVINVEIEVLCSNNKSIKTVKHIRYKKNIHNVDKLKKFYLNHKIYNVESISVDNAGIATLKLKDYHDKAVKDNVIFVVNGEVNVECESNINNQAEKIKCNYTGTDLTSWVTQDKYEILVDKPNNDFSIILNCKGIYDNQEIVRGILSAFQYYSE